MKWGDRPNIPPRPSSTPNPNPIPNPKPLHSYLALSLSACRPRPRGRPPSSQFIANPATAAATPTATAHFGAAAHVASFATALRAGSRP